ncbi:PREDICTED: beta-amylase 8-like [Ipomoea nil]|uniref:beta-amylase 8-like n=1 Tax=Ipomoea nil TaxID=35883 RepID=UPI000900E910|nr:PREDICTED: beta-amylase 8-like [Ipomoea nil]
MDSQNPNPNPNYDRNSNPNPRPQPASRRPRGFAARMAGNAASATANKSRKEREKQKERTKFRERDRRAFTSRMMAGLRQYGNFDLPPRSDMNDVLSALARQAGFTVEPDGNTYRPAAPSNVVPYPARVVGNPLPADSLKNCSTSASIEASVLRIDESLSPASFDSVVVPDTGAKADKYTSSSPMNSSGCLEADQLMQEVHTGEHGHDFLGTPYVPVYVMLSSGIINNLCQLVDPSGVQHELQLLKSLNIDGVVINCWWGIVERRNQEYKWLGYKELFNIIRDMGLKLQVVMAFNAYGGNDFNVDISLPEWVLKIGKDCPEIFFADRVGRWNTECLSWGIDNERILDRRTGREVYYEFMRSFRAEFNDLFTEGLISAVEIGLGASGELKYPSFSERNGWRFPGIGEFQCYDKFLLQSLKYAAEKRGQPSWAMGPNYVGCYNSRPHETRFFREKGDYNSCYGRFFLQWYTQALIDHADTILSAATEAFDETPLVVKIPGIHWWYKASSHAAELTAGYYNTSNRDGYSPLFEVLKKHNATVKLVSKETQISPHDLVQAYADPNGLCWQVLNGAWEKGVAIAGHNAPGDYDRETFMRLVETSKPRNDPYRHHSTFFVLERPWQRIQTAENISELEYFVKCMHGYA